MLAAMLGLVLRKTDNVADFFPLVTGARYIYLDSKQTQPIEWDIKPAAKLDSGVEAVPVVKTPDGSFRHETAYYVVKDDGVYQADPTAKTDALLTPLFLWANGNGDWEWSGQTSGNRGIKLKGTTAPGGKQSILGKDVDTIQITVQRSDPSLVSGTATSTLVLARGIGLISLDEGFTGGQTTPHLVKLLDWKPAKGTLE